jgi:hypothetical protein
VAQRELCVRHGDAEAPRGAMHEKISCCGALYSGPSIAERKAAGIAFVLAMKRLKGKSP